MSVSNERSSCLKLLQLWDVKDERPGERVEIRGNRNGDNFCIQGRIMSVIVNQLIPTPHVTVEIQTSEDEQRTLLRLNPADLSVSELPKVMEKIDSDEISSLSIFTTHAIKPVILCRLPSAWNLAQPEVVRTNLNDKPMFDGPNDFLGGN